MSVAPETAESSISAIPIHVVEFYTKKLFKSLKHLKKHVGFLCLGKGQVKDVEKTVKMINEQIRRTAQSMKLNGDYLSITDGSEAVFVGHADKLVKEWKEMKESLSEKAAAAMWPPKAEKPLPEGITKKAAERIEKRRAHKKAIRARFSIVQIGEMYAAFLRTFLKVIAANELSVSAPSWKEFVTLEDVPIGIKSLSATFLLELSVTKDIYVQRFVANNIALFCIANDNVRAIGEEGMDKLVSIAWVPDDEVQQSCIMAAFMVAKYEPFHNKAPYDSAINVLKELMDSDGSAKVKALAGTAYGVVVGADKLRDAKELGDKAVDSAKSAISGVKSMFGK